MKSILVFILFICFTQYGLADLTYEPISITLSTEKDSYYEGEKITFLITITNTDKNNTYPVLLPHTQNTGQKLFYLNLYDKANKTRLLRATEDKKINMMVHDTGTVKIKYLAPLEKVVIPIHLNDFENYFSYHTHNSSHHSFGVPLFAGIYKVSLTYNPKPTALGDSIYTYYDYFDRTESNQKLTMNSLGRDTRTIDLKIKRSAATSVKIEGIPYFIKYTQNSYWYYRDSIGNGGTNQRLVHITNLPPDSCSLPSGEYYYSHFTNIYAEHIERFDDGDIKSYRRYIDTCPDYLWTEKYNDFKQRTYFAQQLPDGRFYSVSYNQPANTKHQETYCSTDGTLCNVTTYKYHKKNGSVKKVVTQTNPCLMIELNQK